MTPKKSEKSDQPALERLSYESARAKKVFGSTGPGSLNRRDSVEFHTSCTGCSGGNRRNCQRAWTGARVNQGNVGHRLEAGL